MKSYLQTMSKYAVFEGRASRREYWVFFLFNVLIVFGLSLFETAAGNAPGTNLGVLVTLYRIIALMPSIAVAVRRMHDTNHSGWWMLVPFVNLVIALRQGDRGPNHFGLDPRTLPVATLADEFTSGVTFTAR